MPEESLNVYVSSTWLDLQPERAAVLAMTNRLRGLSFLGMEFFGSRTESTEKTSLAQLDHADVYIGIIGGRYGSGITEQEYLRAHERGLPAFIYLKPDAADTGAADDQDRLQAFRARLKRDHTCSEFETADDLAVRLAADLHNWMFERHLARGLAGFSTDYVSRVQAFLAEYVGGRNRHVPFGGRADELAELNRWLSEPDAPPFMFVAAGAGKGKSALLVRWMRELLDRQDVAPVFFPISIRFRTNLASVVFPCLATWLAALHREALKTTPDTPPEVWRGLVTDLLARPLRDGRRLVLIVDGLDEAADWTAGPDLFPPHAGRHARVVVAARFLAGDADAGDWCRRLGWDLPHAARTLMLAALRVPGVAEVLERMGFPLAALGERSEIVHELHRLSAGEPLIVRLYVDDLWSRGESSIRLNVEDLRTIEPGLSGYFARWWDDQRRLWGSARPLQEGRVQALMNFLACALGPLTRDDIFALASPIVELNTWTLEEALEPLQRFIVGDVESGYVYSHPGLAIHFRERLSRREREVLDDRMIEWCVESIEAAAQGRSRERAISPYVLQHFGAHLERHDADVEAFAPLLTDVWRRAWHAHDGTYAGYRADLRRIQAAASRHARSRTGRASLALETRAALCMASVDQLSDNTPPELVVALVQKGVWSRAGAVGYARLIRDPARRTRALASLAPDVTEATQAQILREALDAIALVDGSARASLLSAVVPSLPTALVGDALTLALGIGHRVTMADALVGLAPRLTPWHIDKALGVVCGLSDADLRRRILTQLAAAHPSIFEQWADAAGQTEPWEQAWILLGVHDGLGPGSGSAALDKAAHVTARVTSEAARLDLWLAIAERLPAADRRPTVDRVLREVSAVSYAQTRAATFRRLAPLVDDAEAATLMGLALDECARIRPDGARAETLAALAPHLRPPAAEAALTLAEAIEDDAARGRVAAALVPHLPAMARHRALELARSVTDSFECLCILASVASFLPNDLIASAIVSVWEEQMSPAWRFRLMRMLAPRAEDALRDGSSAGIPMDLLDELAACAGVARFCPPGTRPGVDARVLRIVSSGRKGWFLWDDRLDEALEFLGYWAEDAPVPSLADVTDAVLKWETTASRIAGIERLSPHLPAPILEASLQRLQTLGDDRLRRDTQMQYLALLGPDLVTGRLSRLWRRAAAADRVLQTLRWLADDIGDRSVLRADVIAMLPEIENGPRRAEAIAALMRLDPIVTADDMRVLIDAALSLKDPVSRSSTMSCLVPRMQDVHLDRFAAIFSASIENSTEAVTAAAALALRVTPARLLDVFGDLCAAELQRREWDAYARLPRLLGLARLARVLPEPLRGAVSDRLIAALEAVSEFRTSDALVQFGRWLVADEEFFARCFALSRGLARAERIRAAIPLLRQLSPSVIGAAVHEVIAYVEQAKDDAEARVVASALTGVATDVAASGAWRAGLVLECLPTLPRTDVVGLLALAVDELRALSHRPGTTDHSIALLEATPIELRDPLVALALEGLRHRDATAYTTALRQLDAVLSDSLPQRLALMASLAPYVDGAHADRFVQLFTATAEASDDLADLIANLGWRLSDDGFMHVVAEVCSRELSRSPSLGNESARQFSRLARIIALREESTRAAAAGRIAATIGSLDRSARREVVWQVARQDPGDLFSFEWWAALTHDFETGERIGACVPALTRLPLEHGHTIIGELIPWIAQLPTRTQARTVAAHLEGLPSELATQGAWRAALAVAWLAAKPAPETEKRDAAAVVELACEELAAHPVKNRTAAAAVLLVPFASVAVRERLVVLALEESRLQEPAARVRVVRELAAYAPHRSKTLLVRACITLLRVPDEARASEALADLVGALLPHLSAAHAGRLWREAMKRSMPSAVVDAFVDRLPDEAMAGLSEAVLGAIGRAAEPRRTSLLRQWIGRLPPAGLDRLPADAKAGQSPAFIALALTFAAARVAAADRTRLKAEAVGALGPGSIEWTVLVTMQQSMAGESWPAVEALMTDALRREASLHDVAGNAVEVFPLLGGAARSAVAACVLERLSALVPDGIDVVTGGMRLAGDLPATLSALVAAWDSPAERLALLLPLVPPAQRKALIERIAETDQWIYDSRLFDAVRPYAGDPAVALLLADRAIAVPFKGAGVSERMLELWSRLPTDSAAWHALSAHLLFAVAFDSRTDLMRLLQRMAPTVHRSLGPDAVEQIVESLETISEWWP